MSDLYNHEPMLEMFIFESSQLIEQLEQAILSTEKDSCFSEGAINEIFRIMHTIKGSSAMMLYNNISNVAHHLEDLFFFLREERAAIVDCSTLCDLVLEGVDFIKLEIQKIKNKDVAYGDDSLLIEKIKDFLALLKQKNGSGFDQETKNEDTRHNQQYYISKIKVPAVDGENMFKATVFFDEGCEMENIRAYTITHNLQHITEDFYFFPEDIIENDESVHMIREQGFTIYLKTDKSYDEMHQFFMQTIFLKDLELTQLNEYRERKPEVKQREIVTEASPVKVPSLKDKGDHEVAETVASTAQSIISVNVSKLDKLMDLVGEMVIAEAMVTQNPEIKGLQLESFHKAARQLHKITSELQDMVMSIRMVPLSTTFHKMHRIVRDMCKRLDKEVQLDILGEETEVDKNIIEHISDPLMHLVRNAIDHGIESAADRKKNGKTQIGTITIEAKNAGSDVLVVIRDDGKGLNKAKILDK
ncbi:MAG: Hpt domain-containing protein, partial [Bacillota bacterium]|nr:Hpt domain-containing protein [Bacillota bacterium]